MVKQEWEKAQSGSSTMQFIKKLQQVQLHFGNIDFRIKTVQQQLRAAQASNTPSHGTIVQLQQQLQHWYNVKADISHQHSRDKLLYAQDRNTKAFHAQANYRRRRNQIDFIKDEQGN
ncbi:hypothetical protein MKX03_033598, partial [Papaver bracteatum]